MSLHLHFEQMMAKIYAISVKLFMKGECCAVEGIAHVKRIMSESKSEMDK